RTSPRCHPKRATRVLGHKAVSRRCSCRYVSMYQAVVAFVRKVKRATELACVVARFLVVVRAWHVGIDVRECQLRATFGVLPLASGRALGVFGVSAAGHATRPSTMRSSRNWSAVSSAYSAMTRRAASTRSGLDSLAKHVG